MEVFSVFSSGQDLIDRLIDSILLHRNTLIETRGEGTVYLKCEGNESSRMYIHFDTSFEEELVNYEPEQEQFIRAFCGDGVCMLDISYNNSALLYRLLSDFVQSLALQYGDKPIPLLFCDPFDGFVKINEVGSTMR